jgi:hypothetical protein
MHVLFNLALNTTEQVFKASIPLFPSSKVKVRADGQWPVYARRKGEYHHFWNCNSCNLSMLPRTLGSTGNDKTMGGRLISYFLTPGSRDWTWKSCGLALPTMSSSSDISLQTV